ncbi:MAG TPA: molybdopterin-dependent oxidoreductase, partial [Pseudomonadales bacterium]|nr:molybdopterin-dependent oxidoreductase [Pseudomonadales bacterium]
GNSHFYAGFSVDELHLNQLAVEILRDTHAVIPSLRDMEACDAVFVLGEDLTQTAPRIALALRQAVKNAAVQAAGKLKVATWQDAAIQTIGLNQKSPLYIASVIETRLDDVSTSCYRASPDDLARFGFAIAHAIDNSSPAVPDIDASTTALAQAIAAQLLAANKPLIICGTSIMSADCLKASANISAALARKEKSVALSLVFQEANSLGATMLGGDSVQAALEALVSGQADALIVLENDLYRRADAALVDAALAKATTVVVLDHQHTQTLEKAHFVLSAASFVEGDGTLVNQEGRAQRFFQVYDPAYYQPDTLIKESWRWLHALHCCQLDKSIDWTQLDEVTTACAQDFPSLAGITEAAPSANYRILGRKIARQPIRYSGRTAMRANISVHEPRASQDPDSALAFSMEGFGGAKEPGALIPFAWSPGWNSPQAWNKFQDEVGGHLASGDPGVRLITPTSQSAYYSPSLNTVGQEQGHLKVVPLYHIFGSEELSAKAPAMENRIPAAYVALSRSDADYLQVSSGSLIELHINNSTCTLPVNVSESLAAGTLGLPIGLNGIPFFNGSSWASVRSVLQGGSTL